MKLLIRTDASPRIGGGHVVRCLALAETARTAGAHVAFAVAEGATILLDRQDKQPFDIRPIAAEAGSIEDAEATWLLAADAEVIVVDGYWFDVSFLARLARKPVLLLDDVGRPGLSPAKLLVNPNLYATGDLYPNAPECGLLLGPRYALIRPAVRACKPKQVGSVARILLTLGAGGAAAMLPYLAHSIARLLPPDVALDVVVGAGRQVPAIAIDHDQLSIRIHSSPKHLGDLLARADLLITAGGSTLWEACYLGIPALVVVIADNQAGNAAALENLGAGISLGPIDQLDLAHAASTISNLIADQSRRMEMAAIGRSLVDGFGADRVVRALNTLLTAQL